MTLFAIVVTYNGMQWYDRCLGSLQQSDVPVRIVVIDNASTDGTPQYIAEHFPDVHLIKSDVNLGFAKANNIGIRYAMDNGANYVLLLNQDAWLNSTDTISRLLGSSSMSDNIGIVSPMHLDGAGTSIDWQFVTCLPGKMVSDMYFGSMSGEYDVEFINAAAWLVSMDCIRKVGGFDTSMFVHYGEDNNFCHRVLYHKYRIVVNTSCSISHDRETRKKDEKQYREAHFRQNDLSERINWANPLFDIDMDKHIAQVKHSIRKAKFKLCLFKAAQLKRTLDFYKKVKESRRLNMQGGTNWL